MIADDLTGACDTGVQFAQAGIGTGVLLDTEQRSHITAAMTVISTDSRSVSSAEAQSRVLDACETLKTHKMRLVYKKIDSTCKGHIGLELATVMHRLQIDQAVVSPAFPAMGRVLINGHLRGSGGVEIARVHLLKLLREQGLTDIETLSIEDLRKGKELLRAALERGTRVVLADAETDADLTRIVDVCLAQLPAPLLVGSPGLAIPLAAHLAAHQPGSPTEDTSSVSTARSIILFIGSTNPVTVAQIEELAAQGQTEKIALGESSANIEAALSVGRHVLFDVPVHRKPEAHLAASLTALQPFLTRQCVRGLVLCGGDTAHLVIRTLSPGSIRLEKQILPAIPQSCLEGGLMDGLRIVTKAGGFGYKRALCDIVGVLSQDEERE